MRRCDDIKEAVARVEDLFSAFSLLTHELLSYIEILAEFEEEHNES